MKTRLSINTETFKFNIYKDGNGVAITSFLKYQDYLEFIQTLRFSLYRETQEVIITGSEWEDFIPQYLRNSIEERAIELLKDLHKIGELK